MKLLGGRADICFMVFHVGPWELKNKQLKREPDHLCKICPLGSMYLYIYMYKYACIYIYRGKYINPMDPVGITKFRARFSPHLSLHGLKKFQFSRLSTFQLIQCTTKDTVHLMLSFLENMRAGCVCPLTLNYDDNIILTCIDIYRL